MPNLDMQSPEWLACERHCRRFEAAWQKGAAPALEDYMPSEPGSLRESVLCELVHLDLEFRLRAGQTIRVEDYLNRFPQLKEMPELVLELIEEEYALRQETEHDLSPTEYVGRFPPLAPELVRRLSGLGRGRTSVHKSGQLNDLGRHAVIPNLPGCGPLEILGRGGMGIVYQARQLELDRVVAIKMIRAGSGADDEELQRFQTEVRAAAGLQHPSIVQIHEVGEFEGQPYCVLEYIAGGSLQRRLANGPMAPREAVALLEPLARAMQFAHQRGVIHRDLKPANILLQSNDGPATGKIADFGLAKRMQETDGLTETGVIVGTVQYMAPEQAVGVGVGPSVDVYALGAILYETLTGRPPFQGASPLDTLEMVRHQEPIPPSRLQPKLPRDLDTICLKCLEKDAARRYASAEALADDLRRFLTGEPIQARPVGPFARSARWCRRSPALAGLWIAVGVLIVGATTVAFWYQEERVIKANQEAAQLVETKRKRELAEQALGAALRQARESHEKTHAELAQPGGVLLLLNEPGRWSAPIEAARAALERAAAIRQGAEVELDESLLSQLQELAALTRRDECDRGLALWLEKIRLDRSTWVEGNFDFALAEREYPRAFNKAGLCSDDEKESTDATSLPSASLLLKSPIKDQLLAALDDWAYVTSNRGHADLADQLLAIARQVDPDPWRDQLRDRALWTNRLAMQKLADEALAKEAQFDRLSPQVLYLVGRLLMNAALRPNGESADRKSVEWFSQATLRHPGDFWLNFELGNVLQTKQPTDAAGYYRTAIAVRRDSGAAWNNFGVVFRLQNDHSKAKLAFQRALAVEPKNGPAWINLGGTLRDMKDYPAALHACKTSVAYGPNSAKAWYGLGLVYRDQQDSQAAIEAFEKAVQCDKRFTNGWYSLGNARRLMKDQPGAIEAFRKAIECDPKFASAWTNLGNALSSENDRNGAIDAYKKALEYQPKLVNAWLGMGLVLRDMNDTHGAVKSFRQVTQIEPDHAVAWFHLGVALALLKDRPGAKAAYENALKFDDTMAKAWNRLGLMRREEKDLPAALDAFKKAVDRDPRHVNALSNLGRCHFDREEFADSAIAFRKITEINAKDVSAWMNLGASLRFQKDPRGSAIAYEKAIALNPKRGDAHLWLGLAYRDQGRFAEAVAESNQAFKLLPLLERGQALLQIYDCEKLLGLDKRLPLVLKGGKTNPAEQLALADFCYRYKRAYPAAVTLYTAAFVAQPSLTQDPKSAHRFHAACAAVRAADEKGSDAKAQSRFRRQALDWLRADLALINDRLKAKNTSDADSPVHALASWHRSADLASVRDKQALSKLAAAECDAWRALWLDVEQLEKASGPRARK